jgi:hypothetical protein
VFNFPQSIPVHGKRQNHVGSKLHESPC